MIGLYMWRLKNEAEDAKRRAEGAREQAYKESCISSNTMGKRMGRIRRMGTDFFIPCTDF